ncbi:MAG TPA: ATP-binding protein [Pilimelia sp.]|nr:ATP-binding protein [Pilimelia sp.]
MFWHRGSLRFRLTFVFGLLFFAAGLAVLAGTLILVENSMRYGLSLAFNSRIAGLDGELAQVILDQQQGSDEATKQVILDSMRGNLLAKGGLTVLAVGLVATTAGWLFAGRLLRPLHQITATAQRVAGRTLHRRIDLDLPPSEVKTLADSFDSMLDRLDQSFAGQSRFISNAAHELKTPLALNRTLVEVAMNRPDCPPEVRQLGENLLAVNSRHEQLIDALLMLARAEEAVGERVPVDLADLADSVLDRVTPDTVTAETATVHPDLRAAPTTGDPILLEQVVYNVVDNALRYNVPGGWVHVTTRRTPVGAEVVVTNTGAQIAAHEIPRLFEPFRRLTDRVSSARGSGLGLSIVRAVARAHGGDAAAVARDGGGLVVRVSLPARPVTPPPTRRH